MPYDTVKMRAYQSERRKRLDGERTKSGALRRSYLNERDVLVAVAMGEVSESVGAKLLGLDVCAARDLMRDATDAGVRLAREWRARTVPLVKGKPVMSSDEWRAKVMAGT